MTRKRKFRAKHQVGPGEKNDTSDDDESPMPGKRCPHLSKAINISGVKKALKSAFAFGECQQCEKGKDGSGDGKDIVDTSTWICLQCGHQGCGRSNPAQHALLHNRTPHSDMHDIVVNTTSWAIWCYSCDEEIPQNASQRLVECIELIRKRAGFRKSRLSPSPSGSCFGKQPDLENCIVEEIPKKEDTPINTKLKTKQSSVNELPKVRGLINLGNTCFFNAVMQNLNQSHHLRQLLEECASKDVYYWQVPYYAVCDENNLCSSNDCIKREELQRSIDVPLPECGPLTLALHAFLKDMTSKSAIKSNVVNPGHLFQQICKKSPQFHGFQQQDSHELLRHLLDAVKTEEVKRQQKAILRYFKLDEKVNPKNVDEDTKAKVKAYKHLTTHTVIDSIFGGQLISTVMCDECHKPSQIFEPFMDLSLPVAEEKTVRPGHQKRLTPEEPIGNCFGKNQAKENEIGFPSKYQEKKQKRQAKREAKRKAKSEKCNAVISLTARHSSEKLSGNSINGEQKDDDYESGGTEENNINLTDADVEDNDESETISSHHSRASSKTMNEIESSVGVSTDAVSTSSRETVNQELNDLGDASVDTSGYCDSSSLMSFSMLADSNNELKVLENCASEIDHQYAEISKEKERTKLSQIDDLCLKVANITTSVQECENSCNMTSGELQDHMNVVCIRGNEKLAAINSVPDAKEFEMQQMRSLMINNADLNGICDFNNSTKKLVREWSAKSRSSLAPRYQPSSRECSVMSCLNHFTAPELLTGNNKFGCENCARLRAEKSEASRNDKKNELVYCNASKQLLIFSPPAVLTLHLKRFQQVGFSLRKVNQYVEFPLVLDLAPFCSSICLGLPHVPAGCQKVLYSLYGIVEHSGRLTGGHYTAYVKVRHPTQQSTATFLNRHPLEDADVDSWLEKMASKCESNSHMQNEDHTAEEETEVPSGKWYHISDSHVTEVSETTVLRCQAYLLFYERIL